MVRPPGFEKADLGVIEEAVVDSIIGVKELSHRLCEHMLFAITSIVLITTYIKRVLAVWSLKQQQAT